MPQIQEITLQPNLSNRGTGRQASGSDFYTEFGTGLSQVGDFVVELSERADETRRVTTVGKALAGAQQELLDFSFTLQNGSMDDEGRFTPPPDPGQYRPLFEAKTKEIQEKYGAGLDDLGLAMFEEKYAPIALQQSFEVRKVGIDHQKAAVSADLTQTLDTLADVYVSSPDSVKPQVQMQALEGIVAAERAGIISPEEGLKFRQQFADTTMRAGVMKIIRENPDAALQALQDGEFAEMSPDEVQKWMNTAIAASERKIAAEASRAAQADRDAERWKRDNEEATAKELWTLEAKGELTAEQVIAKAAELSGSEYKLLLGAATGEAPVVTVPEVYSDLRERKARGEDITADATTAYNNQQLDRGAFDKLVPDEEAPAWQKNGEQFIATALKPGELNPPVGAPERLAGALDRWDQWAAEHPNATEEEARREYKAVVEDYQIIDTSQLTLTMPTPRYMVGGRDAPDISATVKATEEALTEGQITPAEFARQMTLIKQWDDILSTDETPGETTP